MSHDHDSLLFAERHDCPHGHGPMSIQVTANRAAMVPTPSGGWLAPGKADAVFLCLKCDSRIFGAIEGLEICEHGGLLAGTWREGEVAP